LSVTPLTAKETRMTSVTLIVLLAGIPAPIALALLVGVACAIRAEERAASLPVMPATFTRRLSRRVTGVYVSQPFAARALAELPARDPARGRGSSRVGEAAGTALRS
jgi:hypothetical protein